MCLRASVCDRFLSHAGTMSKMRGPSVCFLRRKDMWNPAVTRQDPANSWTIHSITKNAMGWWVWQEGSLGKQACGKAHQPEFDPCNSTVEEQTPTSCPDLYMCIRECMTHPPP